MDKSVLDIIDSVRYQKQGFATSDVSDIEETFVVKLRGMKIENHFLNTKLTLNEDDNNFEEQFNDIN